jgi:hypothetical protein
VLYGAGMFMVGAIGGLVWISTVQAPPRQ